MLPIIGSTRRQTRIFHATIAPPTSIDENREILDSKTLIFDSDSSLLQRMRTSPKSVEQRRKNIRKIATRTAMRGGVRVPLFSTVRAIHHELIRQTGIKISAKTVRRDLKLKMKSLVRPATPTRNKEQIAKKMKFARRELKRKDLETCVFSDECWVTCGESASSRRMWVASRATLLPLEHRPRWNQPASLMVWAAIGIEFKSELIILPKKNAHGDAYRLNADQYIRRCLSVTINKLPRNARWQHDGARSHTSRRTSDYSCISMHATIATR